MSDRAINYALARSRHGGTPATLRKPKILPMDLWTIPTDQPKPSGTCGKTMDNKKLLPTVLPHSCAYRPQGPQAQQ